MQSKTSFFNKAVYRKNLSKVWLLGLAYLTMLMIQVPVSYLLNVSKYSFQPEAYGLNTTEALNYISYMVDSLSVASIGILPCIVAILAVLLVFGYLFTQKNSYMIHSFPISRKALYISGVAAAVTIMVVPVLITAVVTIIAAIATGIIADTVLVILYWVLTEIVLSVLFVGLACFSIMLSGQGVTGAIFYGIFNLLYMAMQLVIYVYMSVVGFGLDNLPEDITVSPMCPVLYTSMNDYMGITGDFEWNESSTVITDYVTQYTGTKYLAVYLAAGVVLAFLAYMVYKRKQNETVSEFISVPIVKPIYKMGMSFFIGTFLGVGAVEIISDSFDWNYNTMVAVILLITVICEFIIYFVIEMLIEKTPRVLNADNLRGFGIFAVATLAVLTVAKADVLHLVDKLPGDAEDVKWACVWVDYPMVYEDPAQIQQVIEAHKGVIDNRKEIQSFYYTQDGVRGCYVTITYEYKDGKRLSRRYYMEDETAEVNSTSYRACAKQLLDLVNEPEAIKNNMICPVYKDAEAKNFTFYTVAWDSEEDYYQYNDFEGSVEGMDRKQIADTLYKAILKDIDEGNVGQQHFYDTYNSRFINSLYVELNTNTKYESMANVCWGGEPYYTYYADTMSIGITDEAKNTISTLLELGLIQSEDELVTVKESNNYYN